MKTSESSPGPNAALDLDAAPPGHGDRLLAMLPELSMLGVVVVFAIGGIGPFEVDMPTLMLALMADGVTLLAFSSLVDVASRLRKPLPWWLGLPLGAGILALDREVLGFLDLAWSQGMTVFLPFAWTLLERIRQLWTLPLATPLEKIRRRTLTFDRLYVGVAMMALWIAIAIFSVLTGLATIEDCSGPLAMSVTGIAFYAIAAFNAWRVHRPAFGLRPRSLLPGIDGGQAHSLDPL